ncbi:MAG: TetR family transcriptional regulator [Clostridiales bacterium]|nr:TetR family transcriptional regulator [Clostridiales bacterium]
MKKDEKLQLTKDKLVDAAFELMEKAEDPMAVTSREIAARADVKPAMINYCFGSRENLIYNAFQKQYLSFLKDKEVEKVVNSDLPPQEILKKLHYVVADCLVKNHTFTKAITGFVLFKRDLGQESFSFNYVKKAYKGRKTDAECKLIAYELSTMMQLIIYRKEDIKKDFGIDLDDSEQLRHYIDMRVDLLLGL